MRLRSNKKSIVFVAASTMGGGAERMQINIMNSLPESKFDVYFLNTSNEPKPKNINASINYSSFRKKHARSSIGVLHKTIKQINPDYIFTTSTVVAYMLIIIKYVSNLKSKLFVRIAVPPSESQGKSVKAKLLKRINSRVLRQADMIIAQTEFSKTDVNRHYKVPLDKIRVIRNITDKALLDKEGGSFLPDEFDNMNYNIVTSGALYSVKGFDLLVDAMVDVVKVLPQAKLYILGGVRYELDYKDLLLKQIEENRLSEHVLLLGHKSNPYPYYKNADLFVMSSRTEGFPNVVLEALHYGTPVVATNCVDFTEVIFEGVNGYVVEKNSSQTLSDGILKGIGILKKPSLVKIENFNYEEIFI